MCLFLPPPYLSAKLPTTFIGKKLSFGVLKQWSYVQLYKKNQDLHLSLAVYFWDHMIVLAAEAFFIICLVWESFNVILPKDSNRRPLL